MIRAPATRSLHVRRRKRHTSGSRVMLRAVCPAERMTQSRLKPAMAPPDDPFPHTFQWHHEAHAEWSRETLWFSFISFEPVYKQGAARMLIEETLRALGSRSYVIYELTGQYDMLVRAWIPTHAHYEEALDEVHLVGNSVSVRVSEIVHHWIWQQTERSKIGDMRRPTDDLAAGPPVARELELLNCAQAKMTAAGHDAELTTQEQECLRDYKSRNLVTEPPFEAGIKFIVQVKVASGQNIHQRNDLREKICEALDDAHGVIWDRSLYFCRGHIQFIIMGRVRLASSVDPTLGQAGPFHEITPKLLQKISRLATAGGTKTYTYFFPLPGFLAFKDEISVPERPKHVRPRFDQLFKTEEGHDFEAKATAFSEVDRWLKGHGEVVTSRDLSNAALREVLFAITSMLNADGGVLLLGAAEPRVYQKFERGKDLPKVGKYLCFGLELDINDFGGHYDEFSRALWDILATKIEPNPMGWLKIWHHEVDDRTVAAITVEAPDEWFWVRLGKHDAKFVVRRGAGATEKTGSAISEYQDIHPRRLGRR